MIQRIVRLVVRDLAVLITCVYIAGQDSRGRIQGLITDGTGAAVPGAIVTIANVDTGLKAVSTSSQAELDRFDQVDPGNYTPNVESPGFGAFTKSNLELQARGDRTLDVTLTLGNVTEQVNATAEVGALSFNTTDAVMSLDEEMVAELPRFDRNPFQLTLIMPFAVNQTSRDEHLQQLLG